MGCKAIPIVRGCGERQTGALYLECGFGPGGKPVEHFICDPPIRINDANAMGLSPIGVKLIEQKQSDGTSVWHVFDWVGSENYPNVADFVEEVRVAGLSRRISKTTDFSKLTPESRIILLHSRAWVDEFQDYYRHRGAMQLGSWEVYRRGLNPESDPVPFFACPKDNRAHIEMPIKEHCSSIWWQDVEGGEETEGRLVVRKMPSFQYLAHSPPPLKKFTRRLAMFASFPIHRIVAVRDRHGDKHEQAAAKARASGLPVEFEDQ